MIKKSVNQFLQAVAQDIALQEKFKVAADSKEFLKIDEELGYSFTTEDLKAVVKE